MKAYLDNATTTRTDPDVVEVMRKYFLEDYGVPASEFGHSLDQQARENIEEARETIAKSLGGGDKRNNFHFRWHGIK